MVFFVFVTPSSIPIFSGDTKEYIMVYAVGTFTAGVASLLLHFVFITCLTISAENQVTANLKNTSVCPLQCSDFYKQLILITVRL